MGPRVLCDAATRDRIVCVLSGALRLWGVSGHVGGDHALGFVICTASGSRMRIVRRSPVGWALFLGETPLGEHAGLSGLLRHLREELAPHAAAGRLVIGAQSL
jgi:hypothetical protein